MTSAAFALPMPLSSEQSSLLAQFAAGADNAGLQWASGYFAGLARMPLSPPTTHAPTLAQSPATVLFGSQTGNARRAAEDLHAKLEAAGLPARLLRADAYPLRELKDERLLYLVVSTQGDGEPPDDARGLVEFLLGKRAPRLPALKFGVLGLGDSSYPQFCAIGQQLDARLAELGANRVLDRADLDIDSIAAPWTGKALEAANAVLRPAQPLATVTPLRPLVARKLQGRQHPHRADVLANQRITGRGSARDIRHLEISLAGSGLQYEPGDALGVWPRNPPALVDELVTTLKLDGDALVAHGDGELPLREWLSHKREITRLSRPFLQQHATHSGNDALAALLTPEHASDFAALLARRQLIDLLHDHPGQWDAQTLVAALRPLQPRLYSIASSQKVVGDEIHLTVAHVEYTRDSQTRWGAASHLLATREEGATIDVFIEPNECFRLPSDPGRDIVMIGPGTGVAPFRGFVQERRETGARGRNWLLFGNSHARSEFLYQAEWQQALRDVSLHRLDLAFSCDQVTRTYVQHRLLEQGKALFDWIEKGAHLYVCGALAMGRDVHAALLQVIAIHGGHDADAANNYLEGLRAQGRYARDVY